MAGYFNQLRKKPKHVRDNIAFGVAGSVTAVVALGWFLIATPSPEAVPGVTAEESSPAFSTLLNQFKEQMASVNGSLPTQPEATSTEAAATSAFSTETSASGTLRFPKEAAIMVVPSASTTGATSSSAVLY